MLSRPPVVTIMGHVDHGKTTLLDAIRSARVAAHEAGGITQHVGAYQVIHHGQAITFIDTPGHAAFAKMRARGAQVTDVIILVIAGTEGVKPQTIESIKHIQKAGVPFIIALNKKDLEGFQPDKVKAQLMEHNIFCEGYGGQVPTVSISAAKKEGIDELLEMILLVAEMEEIKADPNGDLNAPIIESEMDKHRGAIATVIIKNGTLKSGDNVYIGLVPVKIRTILNDLGKIITQATPGMPVQVLGFDSVPPVGESISSIPKEIILDTKESIYKYIDKKKLDSLEDKIEDDTKLKLILKADTIGTLEAIRQSLDPENIIVVEAAVGPVLESDVLLAITTKAEIIAFTVTTTPQAERLAEIESVKINYYNIIYKLLEYLEDIVLHLLDPMMDQEILGEGEIVANLQFGDEKVAGVRVKSGELTRSIKVYLFRGDQNLGDFKIRSMKRGREDVDKVKAGTECGVVFKDKVDFLVGDVIKSHNIRKS